jgi:hypothetical protein
MILKRRKSSLICTLSFVLTFVLSLLLVGNGVAGAGMQMCRVSVGQAPTVSVPADEGTCCCCARAESTRCSTGLNDGCGQKQKASENATLLNAEVLSVGLSSSSVQMPLPSFSAKENPGSIPGQETVYLINLKLLC